MAGKAKRPEPLAAAADAELLQLLAERFHRHPERHPRHTWAAVGARLAAQPKALQALRGMEQSGGEPDVVSWSLPSASQPSAPVVFVDCAPESPSGRRSLCYDEAARLSRKVARPVGSALAVAASFGVELLTPDEYRHLQSFGPFDQKTSSWLATPAEIRAHGGALFGDFRYGTVFVYHNGAASYFAARGCRFVLRV